MEEAASERSSRFRPPKSFKEEVSLLERSKPKAWPNGPASSRKCMDKLTLYIGLVECKAKEIDSFYLRPKKQNLAFD